MSRKGSRKIKPLLKDEALQGEDSKLDDKQAHDNVGYNPSREDKDNERKMLVIHEGDSSGLDETETETEQRAVPSRTRTERESTMNTHHSNLPEETEDNQYSTLSRTNKQQSGEISNSNRNIDIKKTEQKPPQKQSESPVGSDTKKPENFYSTLKKTSPKEDGLYNPYAVDNTNIDDYSPRKMDNKQTKTAIYDTIGDKKSSENDYSTLKRETKAQTSPIQPAVPALRPGGRAVDNDYSSLRRTSKRTAAPQRQNADLSKNKGKGVPDLKGNEPTYATVEQRKRPDNTYNTLDRTLSQENLVNRASWTSTDSLLYNPYAVDDTETVPSDRRNISNPLYNHLDKTRAEAQSSAFGGVSAAGSVSNGSAIDFKGAQTNFGFADEYESGLYTELTNYQQGALIDDISETSDSSDQFCSPLRILLNNCVSVVLFVVLFLSVLALFFVILAIAGKAGPGCSKECTGSFQTQQSKFAPDGSSLLELIQQMRPNVSASSNLSVAAMETAKSYYKKFIQEEYELNRTVLQLTQQDKDNNRYLLLVNKSVVPGITNITTKVMTSLDSLKTQDNKLHVTFANLNLTVTADELRLQERVCLL